MSKRWLPNQQEVLKHIREAFPKRADIDRLTKDECISVRSRLVGLREDLFPQRFAEVLEDLAQRPVGERNDIDAVVNILNVAGATMNYDAVERIWGTEVRKATELDDELLRQSRREVFKSFTPTQAFAVRMWLEFVQDWPELKWDQPEVTAAVKYWQRRAKSQ